MNPPGHSRDMYRAESAAVADQVVQHLRASRELFLPTAEVARALSLNPNRLGHVLRKHQASFQVERTYKDGALITVVALRPSLRSSSSSASSTTY